MAVWIDSNSSEDEIIEMVFAWIDVLSKQDYERVGRELGYWSYDPAEAAKEMREVIEGYRSQKLFPNITDFKVSDWRLGSGGNPEPGRNVRWFNENAIGIVASIDIDLPLNGAWSNLVATFLLFERGGRPGEYQLTLEEIRHFSES